MTKTDENLRRKSAKNYEKLRKYPRKSAKISGENLRKTAKICEKLRKSPRKSAKISVTAVEALRPFWTVSSEIYTDAPLNFKFSPPVVSRLSHGE